MLKPLHKAALLFFLAWTLLAAPVLAGSAPVAAAAAAPAPSKDAPPAAGSPASLSSVPAHPKEPELAPDGSSHAGWLSARGIASLVTALAAIAALLAMLGWGVGFLRRHRAAQTQSRAAEDDWTTWSALNNGDLTSLGAAWQWVTYGVFWLTRRDKGTLAVLAAWLLVAASFFTTFLGMWDFTNIIIALLGALGIQIILYLAAFLVAERNVAKAFLRAKESQSDGEDAPELRRARTTMLTAGRSSILMFVIGLSVSVFFSFDSLFDVVYDAGQQNLNNLKVARSGIGFQLGNVRQQIIADHDAVLRDMVNSQAWMDWSAQIQKVLTAAENAGPALQTAWNKQRIEAQHDLDDAQSAFDQANEALQRDKAELAPGPGLGVPAAASAGTDIAARVAELKSRVDDEQRRVDGIEQQRLAMQVKRDQEDKAGGVGPDGKRRPTGQGTHWKELNSQVLELKLAEDGARESLKETNQQLSVALAEAQSQSARSGILQARITSAQQKIDELKQRRDNADARFRTVMGNVPDVSTKSGTSLDMVGNVRHSLDAFKATGTRANYKTLFEGCQGIVGALKRDPVTGQNVDPNACAATALAAPIERLGQFDDALEQYDKSCAVDEAFNRLVDGQNGADPKTGLVDIAPIIAKARTCLNVSTLPPSETRAVQGEIDTIEQENSPKTSHFQRSWATLRRGDMLAWLTMGIAFSIDFLVFIASMLGARARIMAMSTETGVNSQADIDDLDMGDNADLRIYGDDPPGIRNQKVLLALADSDWDAVPPDDPAAAERLADLNQAPRDLMAGLKTLIGAYEAKGLARPEPKKPNVYRLKMSMVLRINRAIGLYESNRAKLKGPRRESEGMTFQPLSSARADRDPSFSPLFQDPLAPAWDPPFSGGPPQPPASPAKGAPPGLDPRPTPNGRPKGGWGARAHGKTKTFV